MTHRPATSLGRALIAGSGAGAILVAATVPFLGRYGWDRDELYFMSASHHLALGYVDFPPVTAWVAWLVGALAGDSLDALRVVSLACGVATVILVALMARELGGGFAAQFGGAAVWALTPLILGSASIYHPTWFDQLAWVAFLYVATRILLRPEPRLWPLLGVVAGFGLEAKYTIVFLLAAFAVCLLVFARETLRTRGPWLAAGIALLLFVPNLVWQAQHGWPSVHFASSQNAKAAEDTSRAAFVVEQVLFLGAAFRRCGRRRRLALATPAPGARSRSRAGCRALLHRAWTQLLPASRGRTRGRRRRSRARGLDEPPAGPCAGNARRRTDRSAGRGRPNRLAGALEQDDG